MNRFLLYVSVAASVGGFLFGFDSGVISGAEKAIQAEFGLSAFCVEEGKVRHGPSRFGIIAGIGKSKEQK